MKNNIINSMTFIKHNTMTEDTLITIFNNGYVIVKKWYFINKDFNTVYIYGRKPTKNFDKLNDFIRSLTYKGYNFLNFYNHDEGTHEALVYAAKRDGGIYDENI